MAGEGECAPLLRVSHDRIGRPQGGRYRYRL